MDGLSDCHVEIICFQQLRLQQRWLPPNVIPSLIEYMFNPGVYEVFSLSI